MIERGQYAALGHLMITVTLLALVVPILTAAFLRPRAPREEENIAVGMVRPVKQ